MRATSGGKQSMADAELNAMVDELERAVHDLLARIASGTPGSGDPQGSTGPCSGSGRAFGIAAVPTASAGNAGRHH